MGGVRGAVTLEGAQFTWISSRDSICPSPFLSANHTRGGAAAQRRPRSTLTQADGGWRRTESRERLVDLHQLVIREELYPLVVLD